VYIRVWLNKFDWCSGQHDDGIYYVQVYEMQNERAVPGNELFASLCSSFPSEEEIIVSHSPAYALFMNMTLSVLRDRIILMFEPYDPRTVRGRVRLGGIMQVHAVIQMSMALLFDQGKLFPGYFWHLLFFMDLLGLRLIIDSVITLMPMVPWSSYRKVPMVEALLYVAGFLILDVHLVMAAKADPHEELPLYILWSTIESLVCTLLALFLLYGLREMEKEEKLLTRHSGIPMYDDDEECDQC